MVPNNSNQRNTVPMKKTQTMLFAATIAALSLPSATRTEAGLFKLDFGQTENERIPLDPDGNPLEAPAPLKDWDVIPTWTFADPAANGGEGVANADGTEVTWKLRDFSKDGDSDVTLTMLDNKALAEQLNAEAPPYALGQTANNPTLEGLNVAYDGVYVPAIVKDDYLYRNPDAAGSEMLFRFANINPGTYNVTVFEGRTTDSNGRFGKVWVDDITGSKAPAQQNTGNYAGVDADGVALPKGQPRTVQVTLKAGEYLWFAEMEDNSGGISGMIVKPVVDISNTKGLFKIDFGQTENERIPNDPDGNPLEAPAPLTDWDIIPTWTFDAPTANGGEGVANADATEVTWKLRDFSSDANKNVTITIMDNAALSAANEYPAALGQTANNPTLEGFDAIYDGILVPAIVKDDYMYRNPDTAGSELLFRFAGLKPGKYNVTAFEGRTTDSNGRFGKVWVDDIAGTKAPATQNTGNYAGVDLDDGGAILPMGQGRTVTVDLKAGEYLWFAEMEDNSGGISGLIIRGIGSPVTTVPAFSSIKLAAGRVEITWTGGGTLERSTALPSGWSAVAGAASPYSTAATGAPAFYRLRQ